MTYIHGVTVNEKPTAITPPTQVATLPVAFGTAAVNRSTRAQVPVNEPILCFSYAEAVAAFGYSDDWSFTLSEVIHSHFVLYGMSPIVLINVLDPAEHKKTLPAATIAVSGGIATIAQQGVLLGSIVVKSTDGEKTYVKGTDYTANFDSKGNVLIQVVAGGSAVDAASLQVTCDVLDPSAVESADVIGGIVDDKNTGLELLSEVFPRFRQVPSIVIAPGFTSDPAVAAVLTAKVQNINSVFKAIAITDLPADEKYADVVAWKADNGYTSSYQLNTYPKVTLGDKTYHLSTQLAGVLCATDAANGGIPFVSPSNKPLQATGTVLEDGTPLYLDIPKAQFLNGEGIVTAFNFSNGWVAWGNRTGAYPGNTDPKDSFIPIRNMMNWINNTLILSYWQYLDAPVLPRLVQAITDSANLWMNGLVASGAIVGGRVAFLASENSELSLMDGKLKLHVYVAPPGPAEEIEFTLEYDPSYLSGLFG